MLPVYTWAHFFGGWPVSSARRTSSMPWCGVPCIRGAVNVGYSAVRVKPRGTSDGSALPHAAPLPGDGSIVACCVNR